MARITLSLDSATADEAREFLFAFQRSLSEDDKVGLPHGGIDWDRPTVRVAGSSWTITTPPIGLDHAAELMRDFRPATDAQLGAVLPEGRVADVSVGYDQADECLTCGAHISDPHDPSCAASGATLVDPLLAEQDAARVERWSTAPQD
jgi:hypothetical protein